MPWLFQNLAMMQIFLCHRLFLCFCWKIKVKLRFFINICVFLLYQFLKKCRVSVVFALTFQQIIEKVWNIEKFYNTAKFRKKWKKQHFSILKFLDGHSFYMQIYDLLSKNFFTLIKLKYLYFRGFKDWKIPMKVWTTLICSLVWSWKKHLKMPKLAKHLFVLFLIHLPDFDLVTDSFMTTVGKPAHLLCHNSTKYVLITCFHES